MAANQVWALNLIEDTGDTSVWQGSTSNKWTVRVRPGTRCYEIVSSKGLPLSLEGLYTRKIDAEIALNNYAVRTKKAHKKEAE